MTHLDCKKDFLDFGGVIYLNCAYQGPMPKVALDATRRALELKARPHLISESDYFEIPDRYRTAVGELIGAPPASIAVTDSTTHGMMLLVHGLDWRAGDRVLIPSGEFPANRFPWLSLERRGVVVDEIDMAAGAEGVEQIVAAIDDRTRLVSTAWVRYQTGERRNIGALGRLCAERGVLFVVDGSQGVGGLSVDLTETPCDLLACSGYKWMMGPYGLGFAYLSPAIIDRLQPANVNWFAIEGARDFSRLDRCRLSFEPGARRFDINETANFFNLLAGIESVRYLCRLGIDRAEAHVRGLQQRLASGLPSGFRLLTDTDSASRSNICCVVSDDQGLMARADRSVASSGIELSRREGTLRVSPFVYNDDAEIDALIEALAAAAAG